MSKESPIYAVPVDPGQIRDENPPEVTRIVEVTPPVEDRAITDEMKKTYRYGYSLRNRRRAKRQFSPNWSKYEKKKKIVGFGGSGKVRKK